MNTIIKKYPEGFIVQATIPRSVKNNTRRSIKTWKIKCLRPDITSVELKNHLRAQVDQWAMKKQKYFERVTRKPSHVLGVPNEPQIQTHESFEEQSLPGVPA